MEQEINKDPFYDPDSIEKIVEENYSEQIDTLHEIIQYGNDLFKRAFSSSARDIPDLMVIPVLFRQSIVLIDGAAICIGKGALHSSMLQCRALFENMMFLRWVLRDKDYWGKQFYVASVRQQKFSWERMIPGTTEYENYGDSLQKISQALGERPEELIDKAKGAVKEAQRILNMSKYKDINEQFEKRREKRGFDPLWYHPGEKGVRSIYFMSKELGLLSEFKKTYQFFSNFTHGTFVSVHYSKERCSHISINPIRNVENIATVLGYLFRFSMDIYKMIINDFRAGELTNFNKKRKNWLTKISISNPNINWIYDEL